jgi:hypothetical protein
MSLTLDQLKAQPVQWWQSFKPIYVFIKAQQDSQVSLSYSAHKKKQRTLPLGLLYSDLLVPKKQVIYEIIVSQLE